MKEIAFLIFFLTAALRSYADDPHPVFLSETTKAEKTIYGGLYEERVFSLDPYADSKIYLEKNTRFVKKITASELFRKDERLLVLGNDTRGPIAFLTPLDFDVETGPHSFSVTYIDQFGLCKPFPEEPPAVEKSFLILPALQISIVPQTDGYFFVAQCGNTYKSDVDPNGKSKTFFINRQSPLLKTDMEIAELDRLLNRRILATIADYAESTRQSENEKTTLTVNVVSIAQYLSELLGGDFKTENHDFMWKFQDNQQLVINIQSLNGAISWISRVKPDDGKIVFQRRSSNENSFVIRNPFSETHELIEAAFSVAPASGGASKFVVTSVNPL